MHNIILCMGDQYKQRERIIRTKKKQKKNHGILTEHDDVGSMLHADVL